MSSLPTQPAVGLATSSDLEEAAREIREIQMLIHRQNQMIICPMGPVTAIFSVV